MPTISFRPVNMLFCSLAHDAPAKPTATARLLRGAGSEASECEGTPEAGVHLGQVPVWQRAGSLPQRAHTYPRDGVIRFTITVPSSAANPHAA